MLFVPKSAMELSVATNGCSCRSLASDIPDSPSHQVQLATASCCGLWWFETTERVDAVLAGSPLVRTALHLRAIKFADGVGIRYGCDEPGGDGFQQFVKKTARFSAHCWLLTKREFLP